MNFPGNLKDIFEQAKQAQERIDSAVSTISVEVSTGAGMVTVTMDGQKRVTKVVIHPDATDDIEMLQDMVRGAVNEAGKRVDEQSRERIGTAIGGMGLPLGLGG